MCFFYCSVLVGIENFLGALFVMYYFLLKLLNVFVFQRNVTTCMLMFYF